MQSIIQSVSHVNQSLVSNMWVVENVPWNREGRIGVTTLAVGTGAVGNGSFVSGQRRNKDESLGREG